MAVHLQSDKSSISLRDEVGLLPFTEVLFVAKDGEISREDKRVLRRTGFRGMQFFSSGIDVIRYILAKRKNILSFYSCIVICHEQLSDMDASTLTSLLRLHPKASVVPLLVIIAPESADLPVISLKNRQEKYESLGAFGTLVRPLTPNNIFKISQDAYTSYDETNKKYKLLVGGIEKASEAIKLKYKMVEQEKIKLFELTIAKYSFGSPNSMSYEEAYNEGCKKLNHKLYEQAWQYFRRAIAIDSPYKADALFGLYQLYKERQEPGNSKIYLIQACQAYIDENVWDKVEECVLRFSQEFSKYPHPILGVLTSAIKKSDIEQLSSLFRVSEGRLPHEDIARSIVTGCFHYELSSDIMRVLSSNVDVFTRVLELLQERKLERQTKDQNIALEQATFEQNYEASINKRSQNRNFSRAGFGEDTFKNYTLPDEILPKSRRANNFRNESSFELENFDETVEKQQVRLGIGSKGFIDSLPLVVLDERHKGSFLGDIIRVAKQTAKIYRKSR